MRGLRCCTLFVAVALAASGPVSPAGDARSGRGTGSGSVDLILLKLPEVSTRAAPDADGLLPSYLWWLKRASFDRERCRLVIFPNRVTYTVLLYPKGTIVPRSAEDGRYEAFDRLLETAPRVPAYRTRHAAFVGFRFDPSAGGVPEEPKGTSLTFRRLAASVWAMVFVSDPDLCPRGHALSEYEPEVAIVLQKLGLTGGRSTPLPAHQPEIAD